MNQFENNPQQIGLNSRQLDLYQDVYVIEGDGSWSEEPKILTGYMEVDGDICVICRDKTAETRLTHWGTWCPAVATPWSDERLRIEEEEQSNLMDAVSKMIDDNDDFTLAGRLRQIHGLAEDEVKEDAPAPLYVVFRQSGVVEGVYKCKLEAETSMFSVRGYSIAYRGNEVAESGELYYIWVVGGEYIPDRVIWTEVQS